MSGLEEWLLTVVGTRSRSENPVEELIALWMGLILTHSDSSGMCAVAILGFEKDP